jgi:hypothetical protein
MVLQMKRVWIPQVVASVLLLLALHPRNPYGYYILLRWVCCAVFAFLAIQAVTQRLQGWGWVLGVTTLLYNPVFRVDLTREIWSILNVATVVIAVASIFCLPRQDQSRKKDGRT